MNGVLEQKLVEYLLGGLPPEERAEVEESLFTDDELDDAFQATRDDLIQAYLQAKLSPRDRERFESHFLASERHRGRLAFVRDLLSAVDRVSVKDRRITRQTWLAAAAVLLVASGALLLSLRIAQEDRSPAGVKDGTRATTWDQRTEPPATADEKTRTPAASTPPPAPAEKAPVVQTVSFAVGAGLEPVQVALEPDTTVVQFRAPIVEIPAAGYEAILHDIASREIWRSEPMSQAGGILVVEVPRALLVSTEYRFTIQAQTLRGAAASGPSFRDFYLRIVRR